VTSSALTREDRRAMLASGVASVGAAVITRHARRNARRDARRDSMLASGATSVVARNVSGVTSVLVTVASDTGPSDASTLIRAERVVGLADFLPGNARRAGVVAGRA